MRLSDAIALGRTLIIPTMGGPNQDKESGQGCALQLAFAAIGDMYNAYRYAGPNLVLAGTLWGRETVSKCWKEFDARAPKPDFSLDAFIDWVRSIEPAEESEQWKPLCQYTDDERRLADLEHRCGVDDREG